MSEAKDKIWMHPDDGHKIPLQWMTEAQLEDLALSVSQFCVDGRVREHVLACIAERKRRRVSV